MKILRKIKSKSAFTLIELLIILAIVGAVLVPISMMAEAVFRTIGRENQSMHMVYSSQNAIDYITDLVRKNADDKIEFIDWNGGDKNALRITQIDKYHKKNSPETKRYITVYYDSESKNIVRVDSDKSDESSIYSGMQSGEANATIVLTDVNGMMFDKIVTFEKKDADGQPLTDDEGDVFMGLKKFDIGLNIQAKDHSPEKFVTTIYMKND